jgi:O-antigen ligase
MNRSEINPGTLVVAIAFGISIGVAVPVLSAGQPPMYVVLVIVSAAILIAITKCPVVLVAMVPFVGMLKPAAAREFSFSDPTFITVALCGALVGMEGLLTLVGIRRPLLSERFRHMGFAVSAYVIFVAIAVCSMFYTTAPGLGSAKLLRLIVVSTLLFISPVLLIKAERELWQFVSAFVLLSAVVAGRTLLRLIFPDPAVTDITRIDEGQAIGASLLIIGFSPWIRKQRRGLLWVMVPLLVAGIVATAARGPLLSVVLAGIIGLCSRSRSTTWLRKVMVAVPAAIAIVIVGTVWLQWLSSKNPRFEQKQAELREMLSGTWQTGASGGQRLELYQHALDAFAQRPLLGWGIGGWAVARYGYERSSGAFHTEYPHNIILETAVEEGAVGVLALLFFLAAMARVLRRITRIAEDYRFLLPVCIYCVLIGMFSNDINNRILWVWMGLALTAGRMLDWPSCPQIKTQVLSAARPWTGRAVVTER